MRIKDWLVSVVAISVPGIMALPEPQGLGKRAAGEQEVAQSSRVKRAIDPPITSLVGVGAPLSPDMLTTSPRPSRPRGGGTRGNHQNYKKCCRLPKLVSSLRCAAPTTGTPKPSGCQHTEAASSRRGVRDRHGAS